MTSAQPAVASRDEPDHPPTRRSTTTRVLVLARVAVVPAVACYAVAVVLAGVIAASASGAPGSGGGLEQAVAVGVPLWLAAHLVPLRLAGAPLGVLPLVPALGLAALVAVVARGALRTLGGHASHPVAFSGPVVTVVATAAASHAVIGVLAAALLAPETVVDASPGQAGVVCGLLAGVAALAGTAGPAGVLDEARRRAPRWAWRGVVAGVLAAVMLLTAGATLLLAALLAHAPTVTDVITGVAPQAGSGAGLTLLSALYLPNAVVAATSWVLGPGVSVGMASAAPTASVIAPLPPVPLLAVMPSGQPPSWAGLVFAVPLAVGSLLGWRLAPATADPAERGRSLGAVAVAAASAAVLLAGAAALAGGRLGAGPFDPVGVPGLLVAATTLGWILVPGAVVALLAVPTGRAPVARAGSSGSRSASRTRPSRRGAGDGPRPPGAAVPAGDEEPDAPEDDLDGTGDETGGETGDETEDETGDETEDEGDVTPVTTGSLAGGDPDAARAD